MKTLAGMTVTGLLLLLLCVWERVDIVRVGYHIERLKQQKVQLQRERDELRVKVSSMTAPERIARAATEKLGMGPPEQGQVVLVIWSGLIMMVSPDLSPRPPSLRGKGELRGMTTSISLGKVGGRLLPFPEREGAGG